MNLKSTFSRFLQTARIIPWSEHGNVILFFRAIEDVFEIESDGVVAKEVRSGVGLQDKRREPTALTLLVGQADCVELAPEVPLGERCDTDWWLSAGRGAAELQFS